MKTLIKFCSVFLFLFSINAISQSAIVAGIVLDEYNNPLEGVNINYSGKSTSTDSSGFYSLNVQASRKIVLVFTYVGFNKGTATIELKPNEKYELNLIMTSNADKIEDVLVINKKKRVQGLVNIDPEIIRRIPSANAGIESVLKTFGVNSNNELSTQYSVRGGNYDENLVYVNEVEIYRPFLVRSGQQEGLSFTNSDLVQNVDFSAGGFQAKHGDKLSSVLDITYKKPTKFGASLEASLLGGSISVENMSKNKKWSGLAGFRYRDNSLLVNSQETKSNFNPTFMDFQTNINYFVSKKWNWSFLGNASQNKYNYEPLMRQTNFGTISEPIALLIFYDGQEKDQYQTLFGAVKSTFLATENSTYKFIASAYRTLEQEHYDIDASYFLGEVDSNLGSETFGNVSFTKGVGSQLSHARNDLDAFIVNAEVKGSHNPKRKFQMDWGLKYTKESIRDRIVEWEVIDSAGFSINNPILDFVGNDQPYSPYIGPLAPFKNTRATNFVNINRISGYSQFNTKTMLGSNEVWINFGVRAQNWIVNGDKISDSKSQTVISPRAQLSFKPDWQKDMLFRFSTGFYYQPPFYRELRDENGIVKPNVKAQKSIHFVLANDYNFKMWERPFKLVTEAYYKTMSNVNTYTLENVRIRYNASNDAVAYTYGLDCRLNGEFVPGTESWVSFGYLKTEENQKDKGYIPRPTDQRLKFGILFQDYMPNIPNLKLYLNLVYNTGLPGGSPSYADPYVYQSRLRDYRRADIGFSYVFTERNFEKPDGHWMKKFKDLSLGLEIFNLFNNQNAITNTWVRDVYTKTQYGIPNYMTTRVFNLKLTARL